MSGGDAGQRAGRGVGLNVRIQLGLYLTLAFLPGGLAGIAMAGLAFKPLTVWMHLIALFAGGAVVQLAAARLAPRIWPSLSGYGAVRIAGGGPIGLALAALALASSSPLRTDDILATPILLAISSLGITLATYGTLRQK